MASQLLTLDEFARLMIHTDTTPRTRDLVGRQRDTRWLASELVFSVDESSWRALTPRQARVVINMLRFFVAGDSIVNANILQNLLSSGQLPQWTETFLIDQASQECVHRETYQMMAEMCIRTRDMSMETFLREMPIEIVEKTSFMHGCVSTAMPIAHRLFLFAALEGIFFAGAFAVFGYFRRTGRLLEMGRANAFISRDETLHCVHAATCYQECYASEPLPSEVTTEITQRVVEMEIAFMRVSMNDEDLEEGLPLSLLVRYVRHCGNRVLALFGRPPLYPEEADCPIPYMSLEGASMHANFFTSGATEYVATPGAIMWDAFDVVE